MPFIRLFEIKLVLFPSKDTLIELQFNMFAMQPRADFLIEEKSYFVGDPIEFTDLSYNNYDTPSEWLWDFGDGTTSIEQFPTHLYKVEGTYDVTLTVKNDFFDKMYSYLESTTKEISVKPPLPVANFSVDNNETLIRSEIYFIDLSTNSPTNWEWTFDGGNPSSSTEQNPEVFYEVDGSYSVTLTVWNENGSDSKTVGNMITITEGQPTASWEISGNQTIWEGESVRFKDNSTYNITSREWSFEGGIPSTSIEKNPTITYNTPGTYSVSLTVTNSTGADSKIERWFISVNELEPFSIEFEGTLYVSPMDNSTRSDWGRKGTIGTVIGANSYTNGKSNTEKIVAYLGDGSNAAYVCDTLTLCGYNDWYLPSKDELNAMYLEKDAIGGFSNTDYWSSTEYVYNSAFSQDFNNGDYDYRYKHYDFNVRCVRRD